MSSLAIQLVKQINEIQLIKRCINEIGEGTSKIYDWNQQNIDVDGFHYYVFHVDFDNEKNVPVEIMFQNFNTSPSEKNKLPDEFKKSSKCYNIGYAVGGSEYQYKKSKAKLLLRIMATIVDITNNFAKKYNPDCLYITSTERSEFDNDIKKLTLYRAYILKQLSKVTGYHSQERNNGIIIIKS